jgi:hypothetical protein
MPNNMFIFSISMGLYRINLPVSLVKDSKRLTAIVKIMKRLAVNKIDFDRKSFAFNLRWITSQYPKIARRVICEMKSTE